MINSKFLLIGVEKVKVDEVSMLLAVAIFILSAPVDVVRVPNLRYPCLNLFKQALDSGDINVSCSF